MGYFLIKPQRLSSNFTARCKGGKEIQVILRSEMLKVISPWWKSTVGILCFFKNTFAYSEILTRALVQLGGISMKMLMRLTNLGTSCWEKKRIKGKKINDSAGSFLFCLPWIWFLLFSLISLYITSGPWSLQCGLVYPVFFMDRDYQDITYAHFNHHISLSIACNRSVHLNIS